MKKLQYGLNHTRTWLMWAISTAVATLFHPTTPVHSMFCLFHNPAAPPNHVPPYCLLHLCGLLNHCQKHGPRWIWFKHVLHFLLGLNSHANGQYHCVRILGARWCALRHIQCTFSYIFSYCSFYHQWESKVREPGLIIMLQAWECPDCMWKLSQSNSSPNPK